MECPVGLSSLSSSCVATTKQKPTNVVSEEDRNASGYRWPWRDFLADLVCVGDVGKKRFDGVAKRIDRW